VPRATLSLFRIGLVSDCANAGSTGRVGSNLPFRSERGKVRDRRVSPVVAHSGDRLLSEPIAGTQPCRREPLFMPLSGHSLQAMAMGRNAAERSIPKSCSLPGSVEFVARSSRLAHIRNKIDDHAGRIESDRRTSSRSDWPFNRDFASSARELRTRAAGTCSNDE
jgi:hypothetical protein